jgi:hypothetical protein
MNSFGRFTRRLFLSLFPSVFGAAAMVQHRDLLASSTENAIRSCPIRRCVTARLPLPSIKHCPSATAALVPWCSAMCSVRRSLNGHTLWSGKPRNSNNPADKAVLPQVRKAVLEDADYQTLIVSQANAGAVQHCISRSAVCTGPISSTPIPPGTALSSRSTSASLKSGFATAIALSVSEAIRVIAFDGARISVPATSVEKIVTKLTLRLGLSIVCAWVDRKPRAIWICPQDTGDMRSPLHAAASR